MQLTCVVNNNGPCFYYYIHHLKVSGGDDPTLQAKEPEQPVKPLPKESVRDTFCARLKELKLKYRHVPAKYKGYEALLEGGDSTADNIPQGVSCIVGGSAPQVSTAYCYTVDINGCTKAL